MESGGFAMRRSVTFVGLAAFAAAGVAFAEAPEAQPSGFVVPFGFARETINADGIDEVTAIVRRFLSSGAGAVSLTGHTDTVGDPRVNQALSERRAALVRRELIVRGVPSGAIETAGAGETQLAVATGDGVRSAANRRVEAAVLMPGVRPAADPLQPFSFPLPPQAPQD